MKTSNASLSIEVATTPFKRMQGLLGRKRLPTGHGLLLYPCNAIHTIGMKFALDVRFFDKNGKLIHIVRDVQPGKFFLWGGFHARTTLETAAGDPSFDNVTTTSDLKE